MDDVPEDTDDTAPGADLWGVEEDEEASVSIDEFADLDEPGELPP